MDELGVVGSEAIGIDARPAHATIPQESVDVVGQYGRCHGKYEPRPGGEQQRRRKHRTPRARLNPEQRCIGYECGGKGSGGKRGRARTRRDHSRGSDRDRRQGRQSPPKTVWRERVVARERAHLV